MEPWARAFEAVYGWAPVFEDFSSEVDGGFTITLRPAVEPIELLGSTGHFRHRPAMTAHVKRMGFGWTDANRVVTAPSPETFNALVDRCAPAGDGYRVNVHRDAKGIMALGPFLTSYLAGAVPVHVAGGTLYAGVSANPKGAPHRGDLRFHFASFGHDMTVHALNYHLVPRAAIEAFRARIEAAMPDRVAGWREPDAPGPLTLTTFFDNDLNRYCYGVWSRSESPADFARRFTDARNFDQLLGCLDRRIDETLRGLGDVPSGDTRDLAPLAPCAFTVEG
jgi:hypothetical protein